MCMCKSICTCVCMLVVLTVPCLQVDFDPDKIDVSEWSFFDEEDDSTALTWRKT